MTASKIEIHKVCEYCGKTFVAWKSTTRFCSKTCNSRAYKQLRREQRVAAIEKETNTRPIENIKDKAILPPKEVAVLLGLSTRNVYYLINKGLLKASHLSTRITLIKRKDIDVMLDDNQEKRKRKSKINIYIKRCRRKCCCRKRNSSIRNSSIFRNRKRTFMAW